MPIEPHALCLAVFLSKASFAEIIYKNRTKTRVRHDIKINVYFNGQLLDSQILSHSQVSNAGPRGMKIRIHRFTGQRLNRYAEKPWIFVPPDSPVDERTASSHSNARSASIEVPSKNADSPIQDAVHGVDQRWNMVASGLLREAGRAGRDERGDRPISGEYLESLASLSAPPDLKNMQQAGMRSFGVIDVVIIWGQGQKDGPDSKYLTGPTPLRLKGYSAGNLDTVIHSQPTRKLVTTKKVIAKALAAATTLDGKKMEPIKNSTPTLKQLHDPRRNRYGTLSFNASSRQLPLTPNVTEPSTRRTTPKRSRATSPSPESSKRFKRQRMPYYNVLTTKQTLEEEHEEIVKQAQEDARRLTSERSLPNLQTSTADVVGPQLTSAPKNESQLEKPRPSRIVSLKVSPQKLTSSTEGLAKQAGDASINLLPQEPALPFNPLDKNATPAVLATPQGPTSNAAAVPTTPQVPTSNPISSFANSTPAKPTPTSNSTPSFPSNTPAEPMPAPSPHRPRATKSQAPTHNFDADFVPPALSEDCCVTFAERGIVRSVGAIRGGWFDEKEVLMGTRFIVG